MESMEVCKAVLSSLRAGGVAEEEGRFGVLDGFGCFFGESAFAACVTGFAEICVNLRAQWGKQ